MLNRFIGNLDPFRWATLNDVAEGRFTLAYAGEGEVRFPQLVPRCPDQRLRINRLCHRMLAVIVDNLLPLHVIRPRHVVKNHKLRLRLEVVRYESLPVTVKGACFTGV